MSNEGLQICPNSATLGFVCLLGNPEFGIAWKSESIYISWYDCYSSACKLSRTNSTTLSLLLPHQPSEPDQYQTLTLGFVIVGSKSTNALHSSSSSVSSVRSRVEILRHQSRIAKIASAQMPPRKIAPKPAPGSSVDEGTQTSTSQQAITHSLTNPASSSATPQAAEQNVQWRTPTEIDVINRIQTLNARQFEERSGRRATMDDWQSFPAIILPGRTSSNNGSAPDESKRAERDSEQHEKK